MINTIEDISHWKTRIAVGRMAFDAGFYSQAARHFRTALALIKEDKSSPELLSINLICLAKALSCLGNYSEAEQLINEALRIDIVTQDNQLDLARDYLELGNIYRKEHKIQQSKLYADKALGLLSTLNKKEKKIRRNSLPAFLSYKLLSKTRKISMKKG